ncbi:hypothetical protein [Nocardiopsis sp. NRRL B-16309]|uniref:hypothetical protein n=1 Tax=Nocardiopsis sp. NRRL B-16309 TaxID=1519494 RepID=UPI0006ADB8C6|nr:hypothetical protein [Nocardiopsis sp. NRRL B-16309]
MRLKSYLLVTGITAAALFGATPVFADEASPEPTPVVPSEAEAAPDQPSAAPLTPEEEECWAMIEESRAAGMGTEDFVGALEDGASCEEIIAEWEESGAGPWDPAVPAEPQPAEPNYTG